ncbi:MAG: cation diffusion facilitator family transporter [Candidatus Hodarchaeales archaeon]|jgi:cobalt-zinc-cadmium efflux system protein
MTEQSMSNPFSAHIFEYRSVERNRLIISLFITFSVMVVELIGGIITNSLALISDAGHMFTHSFAIGISLIAIILARKPPCHHKTFGLYRAEILAAFINGLFLLLVVVTIIFEAVMRIAQPLEILAGEMMIIAIVGLIVNLTSIFLLSGNIRRDLNIRGLFYHIFGDTISSFAIVLAAVVIFFTGWTFIDPLISLFISIIILIWAWSVLKESTRILLEMTPKGTNIDMINDVLLTRFQEIGDLYNTHLWSITADVLVFSTHLQLKNPIMPLISQEELTTNISDFLKENYNIIESTIQIRYADTPVINT